MQACIPLQIFASHASFSSLIPHAWQVIGGGLPVGAYGGREDLMRMVAPAPLKIAAPLDLWIDCKDLVDPAGSCKFATSRWMGINWLKRMVSFSESISNVPPAPGTSAQGFEPSSPPLTGAI